MSPCSCSIQLQVFAGLSLLRKLCNHPDLMTTSDAAADDGGRRQREEAEGLTARVSDLPNRVGPDAAGGPLEEDEFGYWKKAGKMVVVQALLRLWKTQGHKVLLFTQGRKVSAVFTL